MFNLLSSGWGPLPQQVLESWVEGVVLRLPHQLITPTLKAKYKFNGRANQMLLTECSSTYLYIKVFCLLYIGNQPLVPNHGISPYISNFCSYPESHFDSPPLISSCSIKRGHNNSWHVLTTKGAGVKEKTSSMSKIWHDCNKRFRKSTEILAIF